MTYIFYFPPLILNIWKKKLSSAFITFTNFQKKKINNSYDIAFECYIFNDVFFFFWDMLWCKEDLRKGRKTKMMCQINVTKAFIDIVAVATVPQRTNEKLLGGWIWYTRCFFFVSLKYLLHFLFLFLWLQRRFNICCSPLEFFLFLFFYLKIFLCYVLKLNGRVGGNGDWW